MDFYRLLFVAISFFLMAASAKREKLMTCKEKEKISWKFLSTEGLESGETSPVT